MKTNRIYGMKLHCLGLILVLWAFPFLNLSFAETLTVCPAGCDYGTIQSAIDGSIPGDTISVSAGTYTENLSIAKNIIISGDAATTTIIDGNASATVVTVAPNIVVTLSDLKITNGYTDTNGAGLANEGDATLQSVIVSSNTAKQGGGGIYNTGVLTVANSTITDNTGMTLGTGFIGGAGIASAGLTAVVDISNSIISNNRLNRPGTDDRGGGGLSSKNGDVTITDSLIDSNSSGYSAGGIYFSGSGAELTIYRTRITGNETGTDSNRNTGRGGGLSLRGGSTTLIDQSLIDGNISASTGGGIHADANVTVTNSTISGNQAVSAGGGVRADTRLTVDSVTITNNSSPLGGGFSGGSTDFLYASNTVIAGNTATTGPDCFGAISIAPTDIVVVETLSADCAISGGGGPLTGTDPNLSPLANNGGATFSHLPNEGSILIDSGTTTLVVDQRGEPRPSGSGDDIGAVETQNAAPPPAGVELSVVAIPRSFNTDTDTFNNVEVTVFNQGPDTSNSTVLTVSYVGGMESGPLPASCSLVSDTQVLCDLAAIVAGTQSTVDLSLRFATVSSQGLVIAVTSPELDSNPLNNTATLPVALRIVTADIGAAINVIAGVNEEGSSLEGEAVVYELVAQNFGAGRATGVVARARLRSGWEVTSLGADCVNVVEDLNRYVECALGEIPAPVLASIPTRASAQFTAIPGNTSLSLTVTGATPDYNTQNNVVDFGADVRTVIQEMRAEAFPVPSLFPGMGTAEVKINFISGFAGPGQSAEIKIRVPKVEGLVETPEIRMIELGTDKTCSTQHDFSEFIFLCTTTAGWYSSIYIDLNFNKVGSYEVIGSISSLSGFDPDLSDNTAISTIVIEPFPPFSPVYVRGIEVTQAVQNWENGVDLFKRKKTVVRVTLQDPLDIGMVASGRLVGFLSDSPHTIGTILPSTGREVVWEDTEIRKNSLDFLLPTSWTTATTLRLEFEADVLGRQVICQEPDIESNCKVTVNFLDAVRPKINLYGVGFWEDELISIVLDNVDGEVPPSARGTVTLSLDGEDITFGAAALDAGIKVKIMLALGLTVNQVEVISRKAGEKGLTKSQFGYWISLRTRKNYPPAQLTSNLIEPNATVAVKTEQDGGDYIAPNIYDIVEQHRRLLTTLPTDKIVGSMGYLGSVFEHRPSAKEVTNRLKELKDIDEKNDPQLIADTRYAGYMLGKKPRSSSFGGISSGAALAWYDNEVTGTLDSGRSRNVGPHEAYHAVGKDHAGVIDANGDPDDGVDPDVVLGICGSVSKVGITKHPYIGKINGLEHPEDSVSGYSQDSYPTLGPLNNGSSREVWGFDTRFFSVDTPLRVVDPRKNSALMGYCSTGLQQQRWPSSFGYRAAVTGIAQGFLGTPRKPADFTGAILLVSGSIGEVVNLQVTPLIGSLPEPENAGTINLSLIDVNGNQVDTIRVPVFTSFSDVDPGSDPVDLSPSDDEFQAALRNPGGVGTELIVSKDGIEIARVTASDSPPVVTLLAPVSGGQVEQPGITIAWQASDDDGDPLTAYVLYSRDDGTTWKVLANGLHGTQYFASLSTLRQSETARFRVIVSDGFRSDEVISPSMIVSNSLPTVVITTVTTPVMKPEVPIMLEALVFDAEDGLINQETLSWSSSIDGPLGQGESVYVEGGKLTHGCHIIRAEITDSAGDTGVGTVAMGIDTECLEEETLGVILLQPYGQSGESQSGEFSSTIPDNNIINLFAGQDLEIQAPPGQYQLTGQDDLSPSAVNCEDPSGDTLPNLQVGITMISLAANETIKCRVNLSPSGDDGGVKDSDNDNDGVGDDLDLCFDTPPNETVDASGCSVPQILSKHCDSQKSKNHGKYVSCVTHALKDLLKDGRITREERATYLSDAVHSK